MKKLLKLPMAFFRLLLQSMHLALSQIWANKSRSFLTTLGIIIGVASVTAVIATLTGLKSKILSQVESFGTNTIFISPRRPDTGPLRHADWWSIRFKAEQFDNLLTHCPSVEVFSRMSNVSSYSAKYSDRSENIQLTGIEPSYYEIEHRATTMGRKISVIDNMQARQVCLIEPKLRDKLRMDKDCLGRMIRIGHRKFMVVGIIESRPDNMFGRGNSDRYEVFVPFRTLENKMGEHWIYVMAKAKDYVVEEAQAEIRFFLRRTRGIAPGQPDSFRVESLKSALETFNKISIMVTLVAGGVVGISLLVGGIGIMNIMLVSVSERTREIGLRKAVGAKKSAILTQFLVESVMLCFVGGLVGLAAGQGLALIISKLSPLLEMTSIPLSAIVLAFGFSGSVGVFFGMFPAIKAARLDPIEALRHE